MSADRLGVRSRYKFLLGLDNERSSTIATEPSHPKNLLVDIWLISTLATPLVDETLADAPLTVDEFALYGLIADLGPATAADLARATGLAPTTLSGILARCEQRGELVRAPNPADRRSSLVQLTAAGMNTYQRLVPRLRELLAGLEAVLELPLADIRAHLQAVDSALRAVRGAGPRPYAVESPSTRPVVYGGRQLSARQQREVLAYIDWIRHRDEASGERGRQGDPSRG